MRILIVGPKWFGDSAESMEQATRALGHVPALFYYYYDYLGSLQSGMKRRMPASLQGGLNLAALSLKRIRDINMNRRLISVANEFRPDIIVILKGETIARQAIVTLRSRNRRIVSWWLDDPFRYPEAVRRFGLFDMVYMFDRYHIIKLKEQGLRQIIYLPCACNKNTYYPMSIDPTAYPLLKCTIGFVAQYYPKRAMLLEQMRGLDVGLWGNGWEVAQELSSMPPGTWRGRKISPSGAAKVYNIAQICPNVHNPQTRIGGLNTRTFEIPAAGGFQLVDNIPGMEENFDIGREIVTYSSPSHFRELADYYLAHPAERATIAERGRARVLRDHTYEQRLSRILNTLPH